MFPESLPLGRLTSHDSRVNTRRLALYATLASLAWAVLLTGLAAAGNTWVLDRVAGGVYAGGSMPIWMRALYGVQSVLMIGVAWLAYLYATNNATRRQRNLGRFVILMFTVSTAVNAISKSSPERWNALGAAIIVVGIAILRRRPTSDRVDLRLRR